MTTPTSYRLDLPWPRPPRNHNQRLHWRPKSKLDATIREAVALLARAQRIPCFDRVVVQLHYAPGRRGKQDPMNWTATTKPAIDGLRDAGVIPDDDSRHVTELEPEILFPPEPGPKCWLTLKVA